MSYKQLVLSVPHEGMNRALVTCNNIGLLQAENDKENVSADMNLTRIELSNQVVLHGIDVSGAADDVQEENDVAGASGMQGIPYVVVTDEHTDENDIATLQFVAAKGNNVEREIDESGDEEHAESQKKKKKTYDLVLTRNCVPQSHQYLMTRTVRGPQRDIARNNIVNHLPGKYPLIDGLIWIVPI